MTRSLRIAKLAGIASHEEARESRRLGEIQATLGDDRKKLDDLKRYRDEYRDGMATRCGDQAIRWQEYQHFLERLDQAIAAQAERVQEGEARHREQRRVWIEKRQRLESLSRVVDRSTAEEKVLEDRLEQARLDGMTNGLPKRDRPD